MTMQRRVRHAKLGRDFYMDVRYSSDGGETWSAPQQVFQGANWEGRPIEVPNDANGDGIPDIYLFFTQRVIDTRIPARKAKRRNDHGRAVAFIASYDGGKTWGDRNPERYTGQIIHRNYDAKPTKADQISRSGGGMPQPFLLPNDRVAFVSEELDKKESPLIVATDPGDWDWQGADFQGPWTSADYEPQRRSERLSHIARQRLARSEAESRGNGPYASVLPDGRVILWPRAPKGWSASGWATRTPAISSWRVCPLAKRGRPFPLSNPSGKIRSWSPAGPKSLDDNFILLRFGTIK